MGTYNCYETLLQHNYEAVFPTTIIEFVGPHFLKIECVHRFKQKATRTVCCVFPLGARAVCSWALALAG